MNDKVVFLAFNNDKLVEDTIPVLACSICRNKAFTIISPQDSYKILKCTACGQTLGRFGWVRDEDL